VGLADVQTRGELWTRQFDRKLVDILDVQEEIATAIAASLEFHVQRNEMHLASLQPSTNLDSWSAFHRGLDHMYRFRTGECEKAETCFRRSIDLEPGLARPYAGLSFVNFERAYLNLDNNRGNSLRQAFDLAHQAVAIDPMDPMGHWALSRAFFLARDLESARRAIATATELSPSYASAQYFLGWISMQLGDRTVCQERLELAIRLSPRDPLIYGMQGLTSMNLALMGRAEEAVAQAQAAQLHPDLHYQARARGVAVFSIAGRADLAADQLKLVRAMKPDYSTEDFFSVYAFQQASDIDMIKRGFKEASRAMSSR
jgi:tetratricopeptide (TPR) repeat protein